LRPVLPGMRQQEVHVFRARDSCRRPSTPRMLLADHVHARHLTAIRQRQRQTPKEPRRIPCASIGLRKRRGSVMWIARQPPTVVQAGLARTQTAALGGPASARPHRARRSMAPCAAGPQHSARRTPSS
jgi:hypothetical protein